MKVMFFAEREQSSILSIAYRLEMSHIPLTHSLTYLLH